MPLNIPPWLNVEFAERILRLAEKDDTIQVTDVFAKKGTGVGEHGGSDMIRVTIELTRKQGDRKINENKSIMCKFEPLEKGLKQNVVREMGVFDTEIAMMTDTLKKMNDMLGYRLGPRVFHVRTENPFCIIMEDLATQGFRMADRTAGIDLDHCMLTIRQLAKFHASSVALCEKEPKWKSVYNTGLFFKDRPKELEEFYQMGAASLVKGAEKWPELGKRYADKLRNLIPVIYQKGIEATRRNENEFNVINHGDCWANNLLFRYNENSKPIDLIFVDFQMCIYTSPAFDLHYFLNSSVNEDVQFNHLDDLYKEYLRTLTATMGQLGCKTLPPTMEELKKILKEREVFGMIMAISLMPFVMVDKSNRVDIKELYSNDEARDIKSSSYRRIIVKKLQQYDKMGLLDL